MSKKKLSLSLLNFKFVIKIKFTFSLLGQSIFDAHNSLVMGLIRKVLLLNYLRFY